MEYLLNYEDEQQCYDLCFDNECNYIMFWDVKEAAKFPEENKNLEVTHFCEVAKYPQKLSHDDFEDFSTPSGKNKKRIEQLNGCWGFFEPSQ